RRSSDLTVQDTESQSDLGIMYPDIEIVEQNWRVEEPTMTYRKVNEIVSDPPSITIDMPPPLTYQIAQLKILDTESRKLVTVIEVLSPVNKRKPGLTPYLEKRDKLIAAGVNVLEIDLLRRGTRTVEFPTKEPTDYLVALTRILPRQREIWTIDLKSPLPNIPVPLLPDDPDAVISLQPLLDDIYETLDYGFDLDYSVAPPLPELVEEQLKWIRELTRIKSETK
ncbi:MAG: DUF4058 family protein, partial [Saprospiraceae bacterium]